MFIGQRICDAAAAAAGGAALAAAPLGLSPGRGRVLTAAPQLQRFARVEFELLDRFLIAAAKMPLSGRAGTALNKFQRNMVITFVTFVSYKNHPTLTIRHRWYHR